MTLQEIEFKQGMQVKIIAPKGFDLDEDCSEGEWEDIHYLPGFMKHLVGKVVPIYFNEFDPDRNCVEIIYEDKVFEFPVSWVVPVDSPKFKPKVSGKDFLGNTIFEGDEVVYSRSGYREFKVGKILKITPTGARIETGKNPYSGESLTFFQNFCQIVRKP